MKCAQCKHNKCYLEGQNCTRITAADVKALYVEQDLDMMKAAACTEGRNYMEMCRLEESMFFAKELGVKKIGLAFCIGLAQEAKLIEAYFQQAFEIHSVCCKVCGTCKDTLDLEQIHSEARETMCNPKVQAKVLAEVGTELNFTLGLCVGHDLLFTKSSVAPVSCLAVKDRVLAHNPLGAVYSRYWRRKLGINNGQV